MKYAEYYVKQNVVSLNVKVSVSTKSFVNYLRISKDFLRYIKASVIIKKKKSIQHFHLYKIKLQLIYKNTWDESNVISAKKSPYKEETIPTVAASSVKNVSERKTGALTPLLENCQFDILNDGNSKKEANCVLIQRGNVSTRSACNATYKRKDESTTWKGHGKKVEMNEKKGKEKKRNTPRERARDGFHSSESSSSSCWSSCENNRFDLSSVLRSKDVFTKGINAAEKKRLCRYLLLPSVLSVQNGRIKSVHFLLDKQLNILMLVDIIVSRKNNTFFEINTDRELDSMLKMKRNYVLCKSCNSNIIAYSDVNLIMPHECLNIPNFFDNAFCEECSPLQYDALKDTDQNIFIFSNCLFFNFSLIKESKLIVKKNSITNNRYLFFCEFCHNSLGYLERESSNNTFLSYRQYEKGDENVKQSLFDFYDEKEKKEEYAKVDKLLLSNFEKSTENLVERPELVRSLRMTCSPTCEEKKGGNIAKEEPLLFTRDEKICGERRECEFPSGQMVNNEKRKTEWNADEKKDVNNANSNLTAMEKSSPLKVCLFKHKIKMLLNEENIFKKYDDMLFLNEYMRNKSEKHKTVIFYVKNSQKGKVIEIKIFIKMLYICKIIEMKKKCNENFLFFQKMMKVLYNLKKENEGKLHNSETVNVSRELYEDILKMLIRNAFKSDAFDGAFLSYLPLVQ
ncbi:hypothetical protein, conserved [Plasmodium ovale wallikeri]|uniref:Uncharacterized protein n=2 Tax=Plasmodium ovale TaxID=36330 RepID=A0A1A8ZDB1_PLAOA|nr:hypothetical protein, conserved [Plasmodium ovale wallikeri]SBT42177.1 hypothetical protein, conserved [Plasmodium ovale wallikeri]SBT78248.1 conserved Plasmodium protein, unknown function [Plasmodium ovale]